MDGFQAVFLAILQGATEFLPVSSSGHLILVPAMLGWDDQGLAFDVMVHLGSLFAVLLYFRHEVTTISRSTLRHLFGGPPSEESRLGWMVAFATIPVGLVGFFFGDWIENTLRNPRFIALTMAVFALLLWWVDRRNLQRRKLADLGWKDILVLGLAQAISLMPGVSRSGMTITAGLLMGLNRGAAARFSFLMAIPVIILASGLKIVQLMQSEVAVDWRLMLVGVLVSALVAYLVIHWFLGFIRRFSMAPFAVYLLLLSGLILYQF